MIFMKKELFKLGNNFKHENYTGFIRPNSFVKDRINEKRYLAGFTLIEIIISISILSFGILLIYSAFSLVIISTYNISSRFTAAHLAQEGVEIAKNIRDNNFINNTVPWSAGLLVSPCDSGCQADYKTYNQLIAYNNAFLGLNNDGFYSYDTGSSPTTFKRKIIISPVSGTSDALNVTVLVTWSYRGQSFSFGTNEYLYNWR